MENEEKVTWEEVFGVIGVGVAIISALWIGHLLGF